MRGIFITFEGIDGSGKSTAAALVHRELRKSGFKTALTREPTETWVGEAVKRMCGSGKSNPFAELHLFLADRAAHTDRIREWLSQGRLVLCDRYWDSTVAYQGVTLKPFLKGRTLDWLKQLHSNIVVIPDITFILDISPREAIRRMSSRKSRIKFERLAFLGEVRKNYMIIARKADRYDVIDASQQPDAVKYEILERILREAGRK